MILLRYGLVLKDTGEPLGLTAIKNEVNGRHIHELSHDQAFYTDMLWMVRQRENAEYVRLFNKNRKTTSVDLPKHFYKPNELELAAFVLNISKFSGKKDHASNRRKYFFVHAATKRPVYVRMYEDREYNMNYSLYHEFRRSDFVWVTSDSDRALSVMENNKALSTVCQSDINPGHVYDRNELLLCEMDIDIITEREIIHELQEKQNLKKIRRGTSESSRAAEGFIDREQARSARSIHGRSNRDARYSVLQRLRTPSVQELESAVS